ncbi:MAG: MFS transporter [Proteobacteria bacterium]|nr:MFS transporter [Pseudomonadota bacterium]
MPGPFPGPRDLNGRAARVTFACMAAQMAMGAVYLRGPLAPDVLAEFGWSRGDFMFAATPQTAVTALCSPLAGFLTQRYGARPVVTFGVVWLGLLFWGFSEMRSLWHFFGLSIGVGVLVASVGDVAVGAVVSKWVARGRGLALGIVYSGSNLGGFLAATFGAGVLAERLGWRHAYLFYGLGLAAVLLPIVATSVREPPAGYRPPSLSVGGAVESNASADIGIPLREALRTRSFWLLWSALFLFYVYFISVTAHLPLYLTDLGLSRPAVASSYGLMVGIGIAAKLGFGLIADRFPPKAAAVGCFAVVSAAAFTLLGLGAEPGLLLPFVLGHGIATMAQNVVYPLIVAHCFGTRYMAEIYGVIMLALFPGGIAGPVFAGYVHDWSDSYQQVFWIYALGTLVSLAMLAAVRRETAPDTPSEPGNGGRAQRRSAALP